MAEKFLKEYQVLLIKAKDDLVASKCLLHGFYQDNLDLRLEIIFFHFQQCAEKLLKSVLDVHGIKFPHTHDIERLVELSRKNRVDLIEDIDELTNLTEYAVESRYAILHDDVEDADKYIALLDELLEFVEVLLLGHQKGEE